MPEKIIISTDWISLTPIGVRRFLQDIGANHQRGDNLERDIEDCVETNYQHPNGTQLSYTRDKRNAILKAQGSEAEIEEISRIFSSGRYLSKEQS